MHDTMAYFRERWLNQRSVEDVWFEFEELPLCYLQALETECRYWIVVFERFLPAFIGHEVSMIKSTEKISCAENHLCIEDSYTIEQYRAICSCAWQCVSGIEDLHSGAYEARLHIMNVVLAMFKNTELALTEIYHAQQNLRDQLSETQLVSVQGFKKRSIR